LHKYLTFLLTNCKPRKALELFFIYGIASKSQNFEHRGFRNLYDCNIAFIYIFVTLSERWREIIFGTKR